MPKQQSTIPRDVERPHVLFDHIRRAHGLTNDAQIARRAKLAPSSISKIRGGMPITDSVLVRLHENFGITFPDMRALLARASEQGA